MNSLKRRLMSNRRSTSSSSSSKSHKRSTATIRGPRVPPTAQERSAPDNAGPSGTRKRSPSSSSRTATKSPFEPDDSASTGSSSLQKPHMRSSAVSSTVRDALLASPYATSPLLDGLLSDARRETNAGFGGGRRKKPSPLLPIQSEDEEPDTKETNAPSTPGGASTVKPLHALIANSKSGNIVSVGLIAVLPNGLDANGGLGQPAHIPKAEFAVLIEELIRCGLAVKQSDRGQVFRFDKSWDRVQTLNWIRAVLPDFFRNYKANYGHDAHLMVIKKQGHGHFDPVEGSLCGRLLAEHRGRLRAPISDCSILLTPSVCIPRNVYLAWSENGATANASRNASNDSTDNADMDLDSSSSSAEERGEDMNSDFVAPSPSPAVKRRYSQRIASRQGSKRPRSAMSSDASDDGEDFSHLGPVIAKDTARKASKRIKRLLPSNADNTTDDASPVVGPSPSVVQSTVSVEPLFLGTATPSPGHVEAPHPDIYAPLVSGMDIDNIILPQFDLFIDEPRHISSYENVWHPGYMLRL
ncbi:hypothetical protein EV122DRAFT_281045 [Schizophyllum commune]